MSTGVALFQQAESLYAQGRVDRAFESYQRCIKEVLRNEIVTAKLPALVHPRNSWAELYARYSPRGVQVIALILRLIRSRSSALQRCPRSNPVESHPDCSWFHARASRLGHDGSRDRCKAIY
ncbi:hypothetical protein BDN72DRAFT_837452 [Pluteus cervinus]|uniref:Uncharacterized protein n=1 Tax=Pluteus cervinus TaxID=181527 RepID=A0ACD3B1R9_9AGAR|nr:hypothetical protein BDN72DRAFT_837452 [Pluteus cervinus]